MLVAHLFVLRAAAFAVPRLPEKPVLPTGTANESPTAVL